MIPTPGPISKPCALRHGINSEIRPKRQSPNRGSVRAQKARPSGAKKHTYAVLAIEAQHLSGGQAATASRPLSPLLHAAAACRPLQSLLTKLQPSARKHPAPYLSLLEALCLGFFSLLANAVGQTCGILTNHTALLTFYHHANQRLGTALAD